MEHWREKGQKHGLPLVTFEGYPCLAKFHFDHPQDAILRTLYVKLMLAKGFLGTSLFYPTTAHTEGIVEKYGVAIDEVFAEMAQALEAGNLEEALDGPAAEQGFRRLL